jgi:hypothetical protein
MASKLGAQLNGIQHRQPQESKDDPAVENLSRKLEEGLAEAKTSIAKELQSHLTELGSRLNDVQRDIRTEMSECKQALVDELLLERGHDLRSEERSKESADKADAEYVASLAATVSNMAGCIAGLQTQWQDIQDLFPCEVDGRMSQSSKIDALTRSQDEPKVARCLQFSDQQLQRSRSEEVLPTSRSEQTLSRSCPSKAEADTHSLDGVSTDEEHVENTKKEIQNLRKLIDELPAVALDEKRNSMPGKSAPLTKTVAMSLSSPTLQYFGNYDPTLSEVSSAPTLPPSESQPIAQSPPNRSNGSNSSRDVVVLTNATVSRQTCGTTSAPVSRQSSTASGVVGGGKILTPSVSRAQAPPHVARGSLVPVLAGKKAPRSTPPQRSSQKSDGFGQLTK